MNALCRRSKAAALAYLEKRLQLTAPDINQLY
jgi:hypothetical protein